MRRTSFSHEFVESFPDELQEGVLYISIPYASAAHLCACGCGTKVVTPIRPAGWHLLFDGKTVSLTPSIGNGQFPCHSHYWIEADTIRWSRPMTPDAVAAARQRDVRDNEQYFARRRAVAGAAAQSDTDRQPERQPRKGRLARALRRLNPF